MSRDLRQLRSYYNRLDRWLDRRSLHKELSRRLELDGPVEPVTAREAFERAWPIVRKLDRSARLTLISGSENLDPTGRASRWEFFFDLPKRRAKAALEWVLPWDVGSDRYAPPYVEAVVRPFPAAESVLVRMVEEGQLLYRQLNGHWRTEMQRNAAIPFLFRDSDAAIRDCTTFGLDMSLDEVALTAGGSTAEDVVWTAQTRHQTYQAAIQ